MASMRYSKYGNDEILFDPATGKLLFQQPEKIYSQTKSESLIFRTASSKLFKRSDQLNNPGNDETPVYRLLSSKLLTGT